MNLEILQTNNPYNDFVTLVQQCLELDVTDIHFHMYADGTAYINVRVYGEILNIGYYPLDYLHKIIAISFNTKSVGNTSDHSFNKDKAQQSIIDIEACKLRFQSTPTYPNGCSVFMRIIRPYHTVNKLKSFNDLGYVDEHVRQLQYAVSEHEGLVLFSGTANAGKSTSLNACIEFLKSDIQMNKNILTIESPPETEITGVTQIPVHESTQDSEEAINKRYNEVFKALLRVDPQVLVPTEIRNETTAKILEQATYSGSKVISTIHSLNVINTLYKLHSIGIDKQTLVTQGFLSLLVHQRLIPHLCQSCALDDLSLGETRIVKKRNSHGCNDCSYIGLSGRLLLSETLILNTEIANAFLYGNSVDVYQAWQKTVGSLTIKDQLFMKLQAGSIGKEHLSYSEIQTFIERYK